MVLNAKQVVTVCNYAKQNIVGGKCLLLIAFFIYNV